MAKHNNKNSPVLNVVMFIIGMAILSLCIYLMIASGGSFLFETTRTTSKGGPFPGLVLLIMGGAMVFIPVKRWVLLNKNRHGS